MKKKFTLPVRLRLFSPANRLFPFSKMFFFLFLVWINIHEAKAAIEPVASGSFIVNMGVLPQTYGNGVKPWGMIFDLIKNHHVQVKWVINPTKVRFGKDFTYNGVDYKGGTFIILQSYRSSAVNARISYWQSQGMVGVTTTTPFEVNVTYTLKYTPRWTFDFQNGKIALGFLLSAGIDTTGFPKKEPADLNGCDDLFVMPHADPTWNTHKNLLAWNQNTKGWIWAGCHAVSVLENLYNPAIPSQKMNFLSMTGLVFWNNHSGPSAPYNFLYPTDPEMQFMGDVRNAMSNGSEQVFLPALNGGWRPSTKLAVFDPTQQDIPSKSPGGAGLVVYGYAFGDTARGKVMYEAGHNIDKNNEDAVSALRAFFNFSFMSVLNKQHASPLNTGLSISDDGFNNYSCVLPGGYNPADYNFHWTSNCGNGSFSTPLAIATSFIPSAGFLGDCGITVTVTDGCGRQYYQTINLPGIGRAQQGDDNMQLNNYMDKFTGEFVNGYGQLNWNTLTEGDLDHFEIERSNDASNFEGIGRTTANGNSSSVIDYAYLDITAKRGMNYYRLKMVEKDGHFTYSKVVAVNSELKGVSLLLVYPNPFGNKVQVQIEATKKQEVVIRVIANNGAVIREQRESVEEGKSVIVVRNVAELPGGIYQLQISTPEKTMSVKIMKQ